MIFQFDLFEYRNIREKEKKRFLLVVLSKNADSIRNTILLNLVYLKQIPSMRDVL